MEEGNFFFALLPLSEVFFLMEEASGKLTWLLVLLKPASPPEELSSDPRKVILNHCFESKSSLP